MRTSRNIFALLLLVYQAAFLNVFLPGHTRGAMTLDGRHSPAACRSCCCGRPEDPTAGKTPSKDDRDHCAVCQFMLGLTSVPVVYLTLADRGLVELLPVPPPAVGTVRDLVPTYYGNGPRAAAA